MQTVAAVMSKFIAEAYQRAGTRRSYKTGEYPGPKYARSGQTGRFVRRSVRTWSEGDYGSVVQSGRRQL